jgi:peptidoglycan biosynthesis protein MviN/MurJ (putative lipid II flippase)
MGLSGLALATSCAAVLNFSLLLWTLRKKININLDAHKVLTYILYIGIISAVFVGAAFMLFNVLTGALTGNRLSTFLFLVLCCSLGAGCYLLLAHILKIPELKRLISR